MPLHLSDLLARPDLRLSVTYDVPPQQLARTIEAATVSDLPTPGKWLQGGELLMTIGLLLPMEPAACRAYVRDAAEGGAACLALGLGQGLPYQEAPEPLVRAAEEAGLPLLTVPDEVPFIAVTKAVFDARADEQRALLQQAFATQRRLTAAATGDGLRPMLAEWAAATGVGAAVLDPLGRLLATSEHESRPLPAQAHELLDRVAARGLRGSASSTAAGQQLEVQPLGARRLRGLLLLTGRPDDAARSVVPGLVSLLSLELERRHLRDEPERRRRSALLSELLADEDPSADRARDMLRSVGLTAERVRGVVVAAEDAPGGHTAARTASAATGSGTGTGTGAGTGTGTGTGNGHGSTTGTAPTDETESAGGNGSPGGNGAADRPRPADGPADGAVQEMAADLALAVPGGLVRVVDGAPGAVIEAVVGEELDIREVLARFAPRCPAGIGPATAPEAVRVSLRQAAGLLAVSRAGNEPAEARQSQASRLLLDLGDRSTLHGYADTVLGPLDLADHGEELIATLAAWLETGGAWDATSRRLGVHRHTVRNRLDKAMDLTGRRLDDPDDRFDLWLATRIRGGGTPSGGTGGTGGSIGSGSGGSGSGGRPAPPPRGR